MSDLLQSGQHPDADQLSAFIERALPAHEQEETLAHLSTCPHCRGIVALSMPAADPLPKEPARRPWLSGWMMLWPAGAAVAALLLAGIYIRNSLVVDKHITPTQTARSTPPAPLKEEPLAPTVKLQSRKRGAPEPASPSAAPAPETAAESQAVDRLMPVPGGGGLHLHENQVPAFDAARVAGGTVPAQAAPGRHGLPSGLGALSAVASAGEAVAIDTQHTLFFSNDGGAHWTVITQPWQGRAVKVELVRALNLTGKSNAAVIGMIGGVHGGAEPRASVEGPKAAVSGAVTDPAGASIPNVSVAVTNSVTHAVRRTTTDPAGRYTVDHLDPGTYTVEAEAPGFTPQQISGLALTPSQQTQKDLTLAVGSAAQTVEVQSQTQVTAAAPVVKEGFAAPRATVSPGRGFEITTDTGEHWISTDGRSWQRKDE
ncbi:MAG: carboxypeptidase regulatory-like domain-containing protein [Acidobacteriaceae bacterium]